MAAHIYSILKEYFIEIHGHAVKARIMSPINDDHIFVFQTNLYYQSKASNPAHKPESTFNSFINAERHLLQYLEEFQNTLDLGGGVAEGTKF